MNEKIVMSKFDEAEITLSPDEVKILKQLQRAEKATYWPRLVEKYGSSGKLNYTDFRSRLTVILASVCLADTTDDIIELVKTV